MTHPLHHSLLAAGLALLLAAAFTPLAAAAGPAAATTPPAQRSILQALGVQPAAQTLTSNCAEGIHYDDGSYEDAVSTPTPQGLQVMSFTLPGNATGILQVCVALTRTAISPSANLNFNVVFYAADGPSNTPGTLLATVPATATAIPLTGTTTINSQFYAVSIGSALALPESRQIFVGLEFDGSQGYFIAVDNSSTTPYQPTFASTDGGASWQAESVADPDPYGAFAIRVDPQVTQTNCVPSATAMCLQAQRFQVSATFRQPGDPTGTAETVPLTSDTGYLWFFASTNVEAVVKVLDACAFNQQFWVFAGGLTNVQTAITVTDTQTHTSKVYNNPQGTAFQPLQDTRAFPCP